MALNHLSFQGRFVADPTTGTTTGGTEYANFRLAWSEKYKEKETKCFLECKAFSGTAAFIKKYFSKGQEIIAEGKLTTEEWTNQEGQNRSKMVLMVSGVHFCGKKGDGETGVTPAAPAAPVAEQGGFTAVESDELPFDRGLAYP